MAIKANPNPSHPDEILASIYLAERGVNQTDLAKTEVTITAALRVNLVRISRRRITKTNTVILSVSRSDIQCSSRSGCPNPCRSYVVGSTARR
jgi:hypothetical protein